MPSSYKQFILDKIVKQRYQLPNYSKALRDFGVTAALRDALSQESTASFLHVERLLTQDQSDTQFEIQIQAFLQVRRSYIHGTHAAQMNSPINELCVVLAELVGESMDLEEECDLTEEESAKKLYEGFPEYKIQLMDMDALVNLRPIDLAKLLLHAVELRQDPIVEYLIEVDRQKSKLDLELLKKTAVTTDLHTTKWALNYLGERGHTEDFHYLNNLFIEASDPAEILMFFAQNVVEVLARDREPYSHVARKIICLQRAINQKDVSAVIKALHMPEDITRFFSPSLPLSIEEMPEGIKRAIMTLQDTDNRTESAVSLKI